jgi:hypothetical protein
MFSFAKGIKYCKQAYLFNNVIMLEVEGWRGGGRGQQKEQVSEQILHEEGGWGMDALWQTIW